jgi:hypothetical protein
MTRLRENLHFENDDNSAALNKVANAIFELNDSVWFDFHDSVLLATIAVLGSGSLGALGHKSLGALGL